MHSFRAFRNVPLRNAPAIACCTGLHTMHWLNGSKEFNSPFELRNIVYTTLQWNFDGVEFRGGSFESESDLFCDLSNFFFFFLNTSVFKYSCLLIIIISKHVYCRIFQFWNFEILKVKRILGLWKFLSDFVESFFKSSSLSEITFFSKSIRENCYSVFYRFRNWLLTPKYTEFCKL